MEEEHHEFYKFLMYEDEDFGEVYKCVDKRTGETFVIQIKKDGTERIVPKTDWNDLKRLKHE